METIFFFFATLGFRKSNDRMVFKPLDEKHVPKSADKRTNRSEKVNGKQIVAFIEYLNPAISHYR